MPLDMSLHLVNNPIFLVKSGDLSVYNIGLLPKFFQKDVEEANAYTSVKHTCVQSYINKHTYTNDLSLLFLKNIFLLLNITPLHI